MATAPDSKQTIISEELLMSQVVKQETPTRLLVEKGVFTKAQRHYLSSLQRVRAGFNFVERI